MSRARRVMASRAGRRRRTRGGGVRPVHVLAPLAGIVSAGVLVAFVGTVGVASTLGVLAQDLPDPTSLDALTFAQPTVVYDRDGTVELGRFQRERRRVVAFEEIPAQVLDATTTAEDRTFWENPGIDPAAIVAAAAEAASGGRERGASTITQQLVRARLLPEGVTGPDGDRYLRKAKEIIQSLRLSDAFPGEEGKRRVITAYLNEIFYGHGAYGIAAAARIYFDAELGDLSIAQVALLAALPQSPTTLDPYRFAKPDADGRLVVPSDAPPVVRRDWILRGLEGGARWTTLTPVELRAALAEPVVLSGPPDEVVRGGHFTWQVRRELEALLPGVDLETAGLRVTTTLDWRAQQLAERWLAAAAIAPNLDRKAAARLLDQLEIPRGDRGWLNALRGKDLHNAALVALDYRTGDVLAYAGSAGYARNDLAGPEFDPKFDVASQGPRQPGSAFKPILYAAAFEAHALTPGSLLLDVTTEFDPAQDWAPRDADRRDRGPVLVRTALQHSLNVPAIRALARVGSEPVADTAEALGVRFSGGRDAFLRAGLAGALGTVEVTPLAMTRAYATLGNGGVRVPVRMVAEVRGPDGTVLWSAPEPVGEAAISPEAAYLVSDILEGNSDPRENREWGTHLEIRNGPKGARRPFAVKTGTTNDARDLSTYGYLPPQPDGGPGLAVGVWLGNSDHSMPRTKQPATSLTAAAPLWRAFVRDYTADWPVTGFAAPKGVVAATIDAWTGGRPGSWTRDKVKEWFIRGTEPGSKGAVDPDGLLYVRACGGWRVDPVAAEPGPKGWKAAVAEWLARARRGVNVPGPYDTRTAYQWGRSSWGGPLVGPCPAPKPPKPPPAPPGPPGNPGNGNGGGPGKPEPPAPPADSPPPGGG